MKKAVRTVLIVLVVLLVLGAAIGGYFIYRHNSMYMPLCRSLSATPEFPPLPCGIRMWSLNTAAAAPGMTLILKPPAWSTPTLWTPPPERFSTVILSRSMAEPARNHISFL